MWLSKTNVVWLTMYKVNIVIQYWGRLPPGVYHSQPNFPGSLTGYEFHRILKCARYSKSFFICVGYSTSDDSFTKGESTVLIPPRCFRARKIGSKTIGNSDQFIDVYHSEYRDWIEALHAYSTSNIVNRTRKRSGSTFHSILRFESHSILWPTSQPNQTTWLEPDSLQLEWVIGSSWILPDLHFWVSSNE